MYALNCEASEDMSVQSSAKVKCPEAAATLAASGKVHLEHAQPTCKRGAVALQAAVVHIVRSSNNPPACRASSVRRLCAR